jgi:CRP/FNR family transcriptional regulator, cyclic AMP receptor protein
MIYFIPDIHIPPKGARGRLEPDTAQPRGAMLIKYLKEIPLFTHLKDAQLKEIASRCKKVHVKKGDAIFHKTDMSTDLYIVDSGTLKAVLLDDDGNEIVLARFEAGAFFGELSLLDGQGRSATIVADTDSELSVLSQTVFLELVTKDPKIAIALMTTMVGRLRKADEKIESLAFQEVGERLIRALLDGSSREDKGARGFLKGAKRTHKELASVIGSSREAVSKCMKVLATRGIVKEAEGYILIAENALDLLKHRPSG